MPVFRPVALAFAAALLVTLPAGAQPGAGADEGTLRYRQKVMSAVGADMGAIGDLMKYGLPFPPSHVAAHARAIAGHAGLASAAFERKAIEGPTDAKPEIWEQPERFREKMEAMKSEAEKLATIADDPASTPAAIGAQVKALGESCGNCHDSFRKPKEESYKRAGGA